MDDWERWADDVLDQHARESEHLTDAELREREVFKAAELYGQLADGVWLIAHPDDPTLRSYLIEDEFMDPEFADAVLAKMRELARRP